MNTTKAELREKLAAIEHERWADWQKWMHSQAYHRQPDGSLVFEGKYIRHLERQIKTPYLGLTNAEKESDREQVDRYWPLIEAYALALLDEVEKSLPHKWIESPADTGYDGSMAYWQAMGHDKALDQVQALLTRLRKEVK